MIVRRARIDRDLPEISRIARQHYFTDLSEEKRGGFYNYLLSEETYVRVLEHNPNCVVSENSMGEMTGFLTGMDRARVDLLNQLNPNNSLRILLQQKGKWLYVDQLAVRTPGTFEGAISSKKLGERLIKANEKDFEKIFAYTCYFPWRNFVSERFISRFGFFPTISVEMEKEGRLRLWERKNKDKEKESKKEDNKAK